MFVLDGGKRFVIPRTEMTYPGHSMTGEMIDEATIKIALTDLAKAVQAGTVEASYLAEQAAKSKAITGYDILEQMRRIA